MDCGLTSASGLPSCHFYGDSNGDGKERWVLRLCVCHGMQLEVRSLDGMSSFKGSVGRSRHLVEDFKDLWIPKTCVLVFAAGCAQPGRPVLLQGQRRWQRQQCDARRQGPDWCATACCPLFQPLLEVHHPVVVQPVALSLDLGAFPRLWQLLTVGLHAYTAVLPSNASYTVVLQARCSYSAATTTAPSR